MVRKDPEDILLVASHAGLVEPSPLIRLLLKEAIVSVGMLLLMARAHFCPCRGICSPEAAGKGRPDKLASQAFKQVVWRLLDSVGQKPVLAFFSTQVFIEHLLSGAKRGRALRSSLSLSVFRVYMKNRTFSDPPAPI